MSVMTSVTAAPAPAGRVRRLTPGGFRALITMHVRLIMREPGFAVIALLPVLLLVIFGSIPGTGKPQASLGGRSVLDVYVPTIAAIVPLMIGCVALPGRMASFRERNALRRLAVSPVPAGGMLAALVTVLSALALIGVTLVVVLGLAVFHAKAPANLGAVISSFVLGFAAGAVWQRLAVLAGYGLVGGIVSARSFRWE